MTQFLPKKTIFYKDLTDSGKMTLSQFVDVYKSYKLCYGIYYAFTEYIRKDYIVVDKPNLWMEVSRDKMIKNISDIIENILESELRYFQEDYFKKINKETDQDDKEKLKNDLQKICNNYKSLIQKETSISKCTTYLTFFNTIIEDNEFYDNQNFNHEFIIPLKSNNYNLLTGKIEIRNEKQIFTKRFNITDEILINTTNEENKQIVFNYFLQLSNNNEIKRQYMQKILGYFITGSMDARAFFIFYGIGANGKSALIELLQIIMTIMLLMLILLLVFGVYLLRKHQVL
jgi:hypothetical protein